MAPKSVYRRVLGDRFDVLPEVLKQFHDVTRKSNARGTFRVTRGSGSVRNLVATILGLPSAGERVPVHLEVVVKADREIWLRHFPGKTLKSVQWGRGNLLMERFGLGSFSCETRVAWVAACLCLQAVVVSRCAGAARACPVR